MGCLTKPQPGEGNDDREIPLESISKAIREAFLAARTKGLTAKLTDQIIQAAFKRVLDEEQA